MSTNQVRLRDADETASASTSSASKLLTVFWIVIFTGAVVLALFDPWAQFIVFGTMASLIVTLPTLAKNYSILSPWSLVVLVVYIGCGLRSFYIAARIDGSRTIEELFLLGQGPDFFMGPSLLYLVGLASLSGSFALGSRLAHAPADKAGLIARSAVLDKQLKTFDRADRAPTLFWPIVAACAIIGFIGFVQFAQSTGGLDVTSISRKRTTIGGSDLDSSYQSYGQFRVLSDFGAYAFWLACAWYAQQGKRILTLRPEGWVLLALAINSILLPAYSSTRSDALYVLIIGAWLFTLLRRGKTRFRTLVACGVVVVALFSFLTGERNAASGIGEEAASSGGHLALPVDALVYNRNFGDIVTSAHIVQAVPTALPHNYGESIIGWAAAPIPRSIWPDKPLISPGPIIGERVFGTERSGVPPGLIGEGYWAFGSFGIVISSLLLGGILVRLDRAVPQLRHAPALAVLFAGVLLRFGSSSFTGGLGYAAYSSLLALLTLGPIVVLAFARPKQTSPHG